MKSDPETVAIYRLASHLHRPVSEILDLPAEEVMGWAAYLAAHAGPQ